MPHTAKSPDKEVSAELPCEGPEGNYGGTINNCTSWKDCFSSLVSIINYIYVCVCVCACVCDLAKLHEHYLLLIVDQNQWFLCI